ncbi:MAG: LysE family translocator [Candidatus Malihini olakiniferum]
MIAASSIGVIIVSSSYSINFFKVIVASYLAYISLKLYKSAPKILDKNRMVNINAMSSAIVRFRQGFLLSFLNPKPIFFMALFPQFIDNTESYAFQFLVLSLTFCLLVLLFIVFMVFLPVQ